MAVSTFVPFLLSFLSVSSFMEFVWDFILHMFGFRVIKVVNILQVNVHEPIVGKRALMIKLEQENKFVCGRHHKQDAT
ncbi:hypothetical protein A4A49_53769 [Nicotiana attenuata]|uniref:Uncharacterized protein n=1 Tax=Nicotiana attenuata TaxID=49451 RepID=A0A314KNK5_NICAT|nr:hypothetical protein A4A49_53769 [Nicotiana attenuata]